MLTNPKSRIILITTLNVSLTTAHKYLCVRAAGAKIGDAMKGDMSFVNNFMMNLIIVLGSIIVLSVLIAINLINVLSIVIISIIELVLIGSERKENSGKRMSYGTARNCFIAS